MVLSLSQGVSEGSGAEGRSPAQSSHKLVWAVVVIWKAGRVGWGVVGNGLKGSCGRREGPGVLQGC